MVYYERKPKTFENISAHVLEKEGQSVKRRCEKEKTSRAMLAGNYSREKTTTLVWSRAEQNRQFTGFLLKKETEVDHADGK